jgi:hypothetical protein
MSFRNRGSLVLVSSVFVMVAEFLKRWMAAFALVLSATEVGLGLHRAIRSGSLSGLVSGPDSSAVARPE